MKCEKCGKDLSGYSFQTHKILCGDCWKSTRGRYFLNLTCNVIDNSIMFNSGVTFTDLLSLKEEDFISINSLENALKKEIKERKIMSKILSNKEFDLIINNITKI